MSTKRIRDPAGLLPDTVEVKFGESGDIVADWTSIMEVMEATSPTARIKRLRRHESLKNTATKLTRRVKVLNGGSDMRLLHDIAQAEHHALYLDAAPLVIRDNKRQSGTHKERRPDVTTWINRQLEIDPNAKSPALWADAPEWITDQIGHRRFAWRVTACRKARASK